MNFYMHRISDICVEMQVKYSNYIYTPLIHKPWTIFIVMNWCEILDEKYEWLNNCLWLILFGCGWKIPIGDWNELEIFVEIKIKHAACVRIRYMNPHCQNPRGFKVERGAVLGTVPVLTTLPLCCRNFE